jgi:spermidine synthase
MSPLKTITVKAALFLLGFLAMSVQIVIIREALAIFHGNELVIGISLGMWMILTASGAYLGSLLKPNDPSAAKKGCRTGTAGILLGFVTLLAMAYWMPPALVFLKSELVLTGAMAGMEDIILILLITMAPFCMASGFLFPVLAFRLSSAQNRNLVHYSYALDSAGGVLGGIVFGVLIFLVPDNSVLNHRPDIGNPMIFPEQEVIESTDSPFGRLTVTRMQEQLTLYENSVPIPLGDDIIQREEQVHYAMLLHPEPGSVLMISGGAGGAIKEVFKYPDVQVDYIESNPWLIKILDKYVPIKKDDRLRIIPEDPRMFLSHHPQKFDVILLNTPDPVSAELNRFYTREFFNLLKESLHPGGVVSLSIPAAGNYMNESSRMLHSTVYNTLAEVFDHVKIIPGNRDYYLATGGTFNASLWQNYTSRAIDNDYVNPGYIREEQILDRSNQILRELIPEARVNTDFRPYVYLQSYRFWADQFNFNLTIIPIVLAVLVAAAFFLFNPVNLGLFAGGFTSASLEFILILWFQIVYGTVYQVTGLIIAAFMAGLVIGSISTPKIFIKTTINEFLKIQATFSVYPLLLASTMQFIPYSSASWVKITVIFSLVVLLGFMMGALFAVSGTLKKVRVISSAGQSFSADLLGSAIGILLVSVYLVPQIGLSMTGIALAGMNLVVLAVIFMKKNLT